MINNISSIDLVSWPAPIGGLASTISPVTGLDSRSNIPDGSINTAGESGIVITLSDEAIEALEKSNNSEDGTEENSEQEETSTNEIELSEKDKQVVVEMKARDTEVRAHEQAHVAAAGGLAGSPTYEYQNGPDGKRYAVGGHVHIDTSPGKTPEETLIKAGKIRAAAMAPGEPSPQDRSVAGQATRMASEARMEIAQDKQEEIQEATDSAEESNGETSNEHNSQGIEQYENAQRETEQVTVNTTHSLYI
jgi:hypothetical protein